jgi:hypothetical protein
VAALVAVFAAVPQSASRSVNGKATTAATTFLARCFVMSIQRARSSRAFQKGGRGVVRSKTTEVTRMAPPTPISPMRAVRRRK